MEHFEQQLQTLWQQGGRDIALSFLRRAVTMDMPLGKLMAALSFGDVNKHLGSITLGEVLDAAAGDAASATPAAANAGPARPARAAAGAKRRRRSAEELTVLKKRLARMLLAEPGSLNTSQLVSQLDAEGEAIDSMKINALLRTLAEDDLVVDLGGKPKSWRATAKLRQAAGS